MEPKPGTGGTRPCSRRGLRSKRGQGLRALEIIFRVLLRCAPETIVAALAGPPRCRPGEFSPTNARWQVAKWYRQRPRTARTCDAAYSERVRQLFSCASPLSFRA